MGAYEALAARLESQTGYHPSRQGGDWRCPAHNDISRPSLSLTEGDGRALVHCHAGCSVDAVMFALGLDMADLFDAKAEADRPVIVATYPYTDEDGELLFEVVRYAPKGFRQRRPDGSGGWDWKLGDVRRPLWRLPAVVDAVRDGTRVFVVEGERDVLALERQGEVATCNPGGAGKWRPEHTETLRGAAWVVVVADADGPGRRHARDVAAALRPVVGGLDLVQPVGAKDIAELLGSGRTLDDVEWLDDVEPDEPPEPPAAANGHDPDYDPGPVPDDDEIRPFVPTVIDFSVPVEPPRFLHRMLYAGGLTSLQGEPGSAKTFVALWLSAQLVAQGMVVVYFDEEGGEEIVRERLVLLGADEGAVRSNLRYFPFEGRTWNHLDLAALDELLDREPSALAVFDSMADFLVAAGRSEDSAQDVTWFVNTVLRPFRVRGVAQLVLDHLPKPDPEAAKKRRSRYARGSGSKLAKTDATILIETAEPFDATKSGRLELWKTKDRRGRLDLPDVVSSERGQEMTVVVGEGSVRLSLTDGSSAPPTPSRVLECMTAVYEAIEYSQTGGISWRDLIRSIRDSGLSFRDETVREALDGLVRDGDVVETRGANRTRVFGVRVVPAGEPSQRSDLF